jgi:hypothetical protein
MYLKKRLKVMRRYDGDFWGFMYARRRKNNFFVNFRLSLVVRLVKLYSNNFFLTNLKPKKRFKNLTMKLKLNNSELGMYFFKKPIKVKAFFKKTLKVIRRFFFNYKYKLNKLNYRYGDKASFQLFKTKKIKSPYSRLRIFVKRLFCFTIISIKKFYKNLYI